jgi:serine protease inhibitor
MAVMPPRPTPIFRADHPFTFLILGIHSGNILFPGRMADPIPILSKLLSCPCD